MAKTCPHCGSSAIEVEEEKNAEVCSDCGVVIGEGGCFQNELGQRSTFNNDLVADWRTKLWNSNLKEDRPSNEMKKRTKRQIERLHLPQEYIPQVLEMMTSIYHPHRNMKGRPRNLNPGIASCIYLVCRSNGVVINYRNVAEASGCTTSTVYRCVALFRNYFNLAIKDPEPTEVLDNLLDQFDAKDPVIKELAYDLNDFCSETLVGAGRSKILKSIAIVELCIESVQGHPVSSVKFKEVCKQQVCRPSSVKACFYQTKKELALYGQQIPWIRNLTDKNLARFLKEIISFYKECQDHSSVQVKFEWQEKKEEAELQKEKLIKSAKERVDACLKRCSHKVPLSDETILHKKCKQANPQAVTSQGDASSGSDEVLLEHTCCPHCCGDSENCPTYENSGRSGFCDLTRIDTIVEFLLRKGYSNSQLMNGNPESIFCEVFYRSNLDINPEREELDDKDIADKEMHLYIKTKPEVIHTEIQHSLSLRKEMGR